jgi:hypothetical protein
MPVSCNRASSLPGTTGFRRGWGLDERVVPEHRLGGRGPEGVLRWPLIRRKEGVHHAERVGHHLPENSSSTFCLAASPSMPCEVSSSQRWAIAFWVSGFLTGIVPPMAEPAAGVAALWRVADHRCPGLGQGSASPLYLVVLALPSGTARGLTPSCCRVPASRPVPGPCRGSSDRLECRAEGTDLRFALAIRALRSTVDVTVEDRRPLRALVLLRLTRGLGVGVRNGRLTPLDPQRGSDALTTADRCSAVSPP